VNHIDGTVSTISYKLKSIVEKRGDFEDATAPAFSFNIAGLFRPFEVILCQRLLVDIDGYTQST